MRGPGACILGTSVPIRMWCMVRVAAGASGAVEFEILSLVPYFVLVCDSPFVRPEPCLTHSPPWSLQRLSMPIRKRKCAWYVLYTDA